jgi:glutamate synthase (NADPH) small chain
MRTSLNRLSNPTKRCGQSLVVWAIRESREAAHAVDEFLMGSSTLPR